MSTDAERSRHVLANGERLASRTLRPAGGGEPDPPQTFYEVGIRLRPRLDRLEEDLRALPDELRGPQLIFETSVLPNYLSTSSFPAALLSLMGVRRVGTRATLGTYVTNTRRDEDAPTKAYLVAGDEASVGRLRALLDGDEHSLTVGVRKDLLKLQDIAAPTVDTVLNVRDERLIEVDARVAMEAVLHPVVRPDGTPDSDGYSEVLEKWRAWIERLGGEVDLDWLRVHQRMTFVPVLLPRDRLADAARFNPLRSLQPMPVMEVVPPPELRAIGGFQAVAPSLRPASDRRIALFDAALPTTVAAFEPYVSTVDLTDDAPADPASTAHATTVVSAAAFGNIDQASGLTSPPAYIDHFRVWPPPAEHRADQQMNWVLDQIIREVSTGRHEIVSLSIGPKFNIDPDGQPHRWTAALDELAEKQGVLFCVAAGNTGDGDVDSGENLLGIPADLINGLSIGACDAEHPDEWARASYSSVGPGRAGARVAPQVLGYGGTVNEPFVCLVPGGQYGLSHGTSLATPAVARGIAELAHALGPRASANVLRAFAIHHADRRSDRPPGEVGYGRVPPSFVADLVCPPNKVSVLYTDTLSRGATMMVPIPLPKDLLAEMGGRKVTLRWTLAFASPVDVTDPVDYSRAGIEVRFRPHAEKFNMNLKGEKPIPTNRLEDGGQHYNHLIGQGRTPGERPLSRGLSEYAPEAEQRVAKWETAVRVDDSLKASSLYEPVLDLHLLTREGGDMTPAGSGDQLNYALLVTVTAPAGIQLYDRVQAAHSSVLTPVTIDAPISVMT